MRAHLVLASLCAMLLPATAGAIDCLHYQEMVYWATVGPYPSEMPGPFIDADTTTGTLCMVGRDMNRMTLTTGKVFPAGEVRLSWDGRDVSGVRLSSGVYLYSIEGMGTQAAGKMTLLK